VLILGFGLEVVALSLFIVTWWSSCGGIGACSVDRLASFSALTLLVPSPKLPIKWSSGFYSLSSVGNRVSVRDRWANSVRRDGFSSWRLIAVTWQFSADCLVLTHYGVVPRPTQPSMPPGSVNEDQLRRGRLRQIWFILFVHNAWVCG